MQGRHLHVANAERMSFEVVHDPGDATVGDGALSGIREGGASVGKVCAECVRPPHQSLFKRREQRVAEVGRGFAFSGGGGNIACSPRGATTGGQKRKSSAMRAASLVPSPLRNTNRGHGFLLISHD
jgi:hypothetical protein